MVHRGGEVLRLGRGDRRSGGWVRGGLAVAWGDGARRTGGTALDLRGQDAGRTRDASTIVDLVTWARDKLRPADGREFAVRWLRQGASAATPDDHAWADRAAVTLSDILLDVPRYDFNWQLRYDLVEPKRLPRATKLSCTASWDNSADNPANPDANARVTWGDQTGDEMLIGFYVVTPAE